MERKERFIRVLQILETTDKESPLNANQILDKLRSEYDIDNVDRRAIYRDIALLRDCGYEIEQYANNRRGWYMEKHAFEDWEIKIMMDAIGQTKCITSKEAHDIRERLLALTSDRGRKRFSHQINANAHNVSEETSSTGENIEKMLEAMYLGRKIEFQYTELDDLLNTRLRGDGRVYKLNLYAIYWSNNNYYLIGKHDNHEGLTNYRLDRIRSLKICNEKSTSARETVGENPEIQIQNYIDRSVNNYSGDMIRIRLEYTPERRANGILKDFAGDDITVTKRKDGKAEASFVKLHSKPLVGWLMQYANMFEVKEPEILRNEVIDGLKSALEVYGVKGLEKE